MKAWTLARRDLRGGWKNFRLALAGLALGVATIAGIGSFGAGMTDGLRENGRAILGGDIALQTAMIAPGDAQRAWLGERGALSLTVDLNAMATAGDKPPLLVGLRAVDALWPLYGEAVLAPPMAVADALATAPDGVAGAVVDAAFLERMGLAPGDGFRLGEGSFRVAARLLDEPDRASAPFQLGPRVIVSQEALRATGLAGPGSLVRHLARLRLPAGVAVETVLDEIAGAWPEAGWRVRSHADANPELRRFLEQLAMFIALVGLAALLVGGIGIAGAVTVWLERKTATIAIMKSLGASAGLIFAVYLLQLAAMAAAGIAAGLAAGALLPLLVAEAARSVLPVAPSAAIHAGPLVLAAAFGLAVALMFALLPLARARETPPAALLRRQPRAGRGAPSGWRRFAGGLGPAGGRDLALLALLAAGLAALAVFASADRSLAAWFVGAAAGALLLFRLAGHGVEAAARLAGRLAARGPLALRLALANLHRRGAATVSVTLAFGIALTVLATVACVAANLRHELSESLPRGAPAVFFVDIQPHQIEPFRAMAAAAPGIQGLRSVPSLRGRIVAIDGVAVAEAEIDPEVRWSVEGDRGVTYAAAPPQGAELVAGAWWPPDHDGPPLLSFDAEIAAGYGLEVGETLTVNVLGREIVATVANLRRIDWSTMGINFTLIYAPGLLEGAPHTHIATVHAEPGAETALLAEAARRFPNVSAVGVRDVLADVLAILGRIDAAIGAIAALTLAAGVVVIAESVAAAQRRRRYDAAVMKVLGAARPLLAAVFTLEHLLLGLAAAVLALAAGGACAWAVVRFALDIPWVTPWWPPLAVAFLALAVSLAAGLAASWRALAPPAATVLRAE